MATRSTRTTTAAPKAKVTKITKAAPEKTAAAPKAAAVKAPATTVVETVKPVISGVQIKKPELIDRVVAETGMKKKDVKPVVEGMLAVLGSTLMQGEELNVPPLGKVMINRVKDMSNATILNIKVRHPKQDGAAVKTPLADAAE